MDSKVSYQGLRDGSGKINSSSNNVNRILEESYQLMKTINDSWQSDAAASTLAKFEGLQKNFENFYLELQNFSKFLSQTADTYEAADKAISSKAEELL